MATKKYQSRLKRLTLLFFLFNSLPVGVYSQSVLPFQMPENNKKQEIYDEIDFFNFSALAFDSRNCPYGFNIHEEFGYLRTLRNGVWVKINYLDELTQEHIGAEVSNAHLTNGHHQPRISITSDDHLYITLNYLVDGEQKWAILYLDDLNTDDFQVEVLSGRITTVTVEQFTGHNLKKKETPGILVTELGDSFASLKWPEPKVSWTISNVHVLKFLIPFRSENGKVEYNSTVLGTTLGNTTIHSGGDAVMATLGTSTYITFSGFNEERINKEAARDRVNLGYLAEIKRPESLSGSTSVKKRFMGVQSVFGHIDSHSQGGVVLDANGKLHYFAGNHAASDEYFRSVHSVNDSEFDFEAPNEWRQYGKTTPDGDFSYDTPVVDNNNTIYFAYRQRNVGPARGLYVKSAPVNITDWGSSLGQLIVRPPSPWSHDGQYIIFYHRLVMDRVGNVHLSSGFLEFINYEKSEYPRINVFRKSGIDGWQKSTRETYLNNLKL